jgi:hypothetical protein
MSTLSRFLALALIALPLATIPAAAQLRQPSDRQDKIEQDAPDATAQDQADPGKIMHRVLPFLDGQTMRYYNGDHQLEAYARRRGLSIRFYDANDNYLGRARRVTQEITRYYGADGTYLGRRINQKQTLATRVTAPRPDEGTAGLAGVSPGNPVAAGAD